MDSSSTFYCVNVSAHRPFLRSSPGRSRKYSLDTSFLTDVLDSQEAARETMERLDDSHRPLGVTPVAAAELSVGTNLVAPGERRRADDVLDSLRWLDVPRRTTRRAGETQVSLKRAGEPIPFTGCLLAGTTA
jgi:predicted nucleic acid-binding protein